MRTLSTLRRLWSLLLLGIFLVILLDVIALALPVVPVDVGLGGVITMVVGSVILLLLISAAPRSAKTQPLEVEPPVRGTWVAMNSPGQALPSHGTRTRGQYSAVDLCGPSDETTPPLVRWGLRGNPPQDYPCFGQPVHSMAAGTVVGTRDHQRDHRARNTWQGLLFLMTLEALLREFGGTHVVLGNHVIIEHDDGTCAVYAHLKQRSAVVAKNQRVAAGEVIAQFGNTGNTSMPHLHVQLMDRRSVDAAAGLPMVWSGVSLDGGLDPQFEKYASEPAPTALAAMPRNGEIFSAARTSAGFGRPG